MADEPDNSDEMGQDPTWPAAELEAEARALIDALLDERITPPQRGRLEKLVVENPSVARLYLEIVHLWFSIPFHVARGRINLSDLAGDFSQGSNCPLDESLILPALRETDGDEEEDVAITLPPTPPGNTASAGRSRKLIWWGSSAAALIMAVGAFWIMHSRRPAVVPGAKEPLAQQVAVVYPATITATAGLHAGPSAGLSPGASLLEGQMLQLTDGAVELTFSSGAVALVKGPARARIINQNAMALEDGSMTAHVPGAAKGFLVTSPGLSVVDQGTNFGVRADAGGTASEAHVFVGKVQVTGLDSAGRATWPAIDAVAGQAFRHDIAVIAAPAPIPCAPAAFTRDITAIRLPIPMRGTGDGALPGSPDPNWQIVSVPNDPGWTPRAAMVAGNLPQAYTKEVAEGKWIGVNSKLDNQPVGSFVFRTSVDLADFDPASVSIRASIAADDFVSDILINGVRTGLSTSPDNPNFSYVKTTLLLPTTSWHKGINQIDVVVVNAQNAVNPNAMFLHLDWAATACAAVRR